MGFTPTNKNPRRVRRGFCFVKLLRGIWRGGLFLRHWLYRRSGIGVCYSGTRLRYAPGGLHHCRRKWRVAIPALHHLVVHIAHTRTETLVPHPSLKLTNLQANGKRNG